MTESDLLLRGLDGDGILRLTLNDARRRNALSEAMLRELRSAFAYADVDHAVCVVVLAAKGPAFSAGHDLKELAARRADTEGGKAYFAEVMAQCSGVMRAIVNCRKPVIAEVAGVATAAGCQLIASCDLAFADNGAQFATPGAKIGLFCSTPMVALSRNLSSKHAMEMLLSGEMISAARATEIGPVNRAVAPAELRSVTTAMARRVASKSSHTLAIGERAFYAQREFSLAEASDYASGVMVENMMARDAAEGIAAFIHKRSPEWQDA